MGNMNTLWVTRVNLTTLDVDVPFEIERGSNSEPHMLDRDDTGYAYLSMARAENGNWKLYGWVRRTVWNQYLDPPYGWYTEVTDSIQYGEYGPNFERLGPVRSLDFNRTGDTNDWAFLPAYVDNYLGPAGAFAQFTDERPGGGWPAN